MLKGCLESVAFHLNNTILKIFHQKNYEIRTTAFCFICTRRFFENGTENEQRTSKYYGCIKNRTQTPTHQQNLSFASYLNFWR